MHSDSDANPYDNNAPIPNPYETPGYGAPSPGAKPDNYGQPQQGNQYPPQQQGNQYPPQQPPYPQQQGNQYPAQQPPYSPQQQGNQYPPQQYPYSSPGNQYPPSQGSAPTVYGPYSQQPGGAAQNTPYQYPNAPLPQYNQGGQPPNKRTSSGMRIALLVIVALVVIFAVIAAIAIPAHNAQVASTNATATAQTNAHNAATAQANAFITATAQAKTYATATAVASTYPFSSNLQFNDPLNDNSRGNGWEENANCAFTGGAYHVTETTDNTFFTCSALKSNFKDFTYQATIQFKKGDVGAITFRGNTQQQHFYSYVVGNDGSFALLLYTNPNTKAKTLREGNALFGAKQSLQAGVVARGSQINLYINGQSVASVSDSTYSSGQIGVAAYNISGGVDTAFTNAQVWGL